MDLNNFPSQSSQLFDPTQPDAATFYASEHHVHALATQNSDANIIVDANSDTDGVCSESRESSEDEETDEDREQYNLQIQQYALNPAWAVLPNPDFCLVDFGDTQNDNGGYVVGGEFVVGQVFSSKHELQNAVKGYSITKNYLFDVKESKSDKYIVECQNKKDFSCPWRIRAVRKSCNSNEFTIVRYPGPHTCFAELGEMNHANLSSDYVSQHIINMVRTDPSMKIKLIIRHVKDTWGYDISYRKAWIAKQKAVAKIYGDWDASYHHLQKWLEEMKRRNPGSIVQWCTRPTHNPRVVVFERVFWAFTPSIIGFAMCRPLVTIDSTHLYGKYRGCLLVAMAVDGNNQLFPLAFAVVESENNSSWSWFLICLRHFIVKKNDGICFISDRHQGILHGMKNECPGWVHRYCIRHLGSNVAKHYGAHIQDEFKKVAHQRQLKKFRKNWSELLKNQGCKGIDKYLIGQAGPMEAWSIHLDGGHRYGVVSINHAEVYNAIMKDSRAMPIAALVQFTFIKTNTWFVERSWMAQRALLTGADYPPNVQLILHKNMLKGGYHDQEMFDRQQGVFSATTRRGTRLSGRGGNTQIVDLRKSECSCSKWQIYHIPCSHVACVCRLQKYNIGQFMDQCFRMDNYFATSGTSFKPIPDEAYWSNFEGPTCIPDLNMMRGKGRPKATRYKNEMDEVRAPSSSRQKCSVCGNPGHNKKKCPSRAGTSL